MSPQLNLSNAQISRAAIERLYIAMRHLFIRGSYKPNGVSGAEMRKSMLELQPEIYGSIADKEKVALSGLLYVFQRLPKGIEACHTIKLISREGYQHSFEAIVPAKRRRNCYRIDQHQMYIEMTRGKSDIYDVLTHLSFLYIEAQKIKNNALDSKGNEKRDWVMFKKMFKQIQKKSKVNTAVSYSYLSTLLGRTFEEVTEAVDKFKNTRAVSELIKIVYWLGKISIDESYGRISKEISFSAKLREFAGPHIYGEKWANGIKKILFAHDMLDRPIHIISANTHSVMNCLYAKSALKKKVKITALLDVAEDLSIGKNKDKRNIVYKYALKNGMIPVQNQEGTNIDVQIFDCQKINTQILPKELNATIKKNAVIVVMDYAFGEQAYECMDELLKPYEINEKKIKLNVQSINIMGKAGILEGGKGDIMIPNAHIFEGTADNYPFVNKMQTEIFEDSGLQVFYGPMITVLGTSLQNKNVLRYFHKSSWKGIGLEMEGAHYQKAIQSASQIRNTIKKSVTLRYAYYASDNPLLSGGTLASGALGKSGVMPTYLITLSFLNSIFTD